MLRVKHDFLFNNLRNLLVCKRNLKQLKQKLHWWNSNPIYHKLLEEQTLSQKEWYYPRRTENQKVSSFYKKLSIFLKEKVDGYA